MAGRGLELGFEAPGISILEVCGKLIPTLYRKKLRRVQPKEGEKEWTWKGERCLDGGEKRIFADLFSRPIYFRHAHLSSGRAQVD